jgi:hypothetical protein
MLLLSVLLLSGLLLTGPMPTTARAAEWQATVMQETDVLDDNYASVGRLAAGTEVTVRLCVRAGAICEVTVDGKVRSVDGSKLATTFEGQQMTVTEAEQSYSAALQTAPVAASQDIIAWGDSLTAGAGGGKGNDYPTVASRLFPAWRDVINAGIGGQTSTSIAARMNAVPTLLTFGGDAIPSSGIAEVTERSVTPITNQGPHSLDGTVCGIYGVLGASTADAGKTYSYGFRRLEAGDAVPCPPRSVFLFDLPQETKGRIAWLWLGRNGADPGHSVVDDIAAAVSSLGGAP